MTTVLVTGGSGFIGTNLVERYRSRGTPVVSYDVRPPRVRTHQEYWASGDVSDRDRLLEVLKEVKPTHVVHLGARADLRGRSMAEYRVNTDGVRAVIDALATYGQATRTVFASSRLVCDLGIVPSSDLDYAPPNCYARSKVIGEQLVRLHRGGGEWVIVRPTSIWGPWEGTSYRAFFLSLARGTYLQPGRRQVRKHYGYVGNTVHQIDRLLTAAPTERVHGRTLYLADPEPVELGAFAAEIRSAMGLPPPRVVPPPLLRGVALAGDALRLAGMASPPLTSDRLRHLRMDMLFDLAETAEIVGPLPYTMREGVAATVAHLRETGDLRTLMGRRV